MASIIGTDFGEDLFGTPQGDSVFGLGGDDRLWGLANDDILRGGDGDDQLWSGDGNDFLYGDAGADLFLFEPEREARDTIQDFNVLDGDRLSFAPFNAEVYYDVIATPSGAEIRLSNNQTIVLAGVTPAELTPLVVKSARRGLDWIDWSDVGGIGAQKYRYATAGIEIGDTRYTFNSANPNSGDVTDHVIMRRGTLVNGEWTWGNDQTAIGPGANGAWDDRHVGDPSITRGQFSYQSTNYSYAMFYLGADGTTPSGGVNQIGLALAQSLDGPWVKVSVDAPLVSVGVGERDAWGVGQPSATSVGGGTVMLVYTRQLPGQIPHTYRQVLDLSSASNPITVQPEMALTTSGLTKFDGSPDPVNHGGAVMFDAGRDVFWIIRNMHPNPTDNPNFISSALQIASLPAANVWGGGGQWQVQEEILSEELAVDRVFDGGFFRNEWGGILNQSVLQTIPSTAFSATSLGNQNPLWSYRPQIVNVLLDIGPADFNLDGITDAKDLNHWQEGFGIPSGAVRSDGDADGDADVDGHDFLMWQQNFGAGSGGASQVSVGQSATSVEVLASGTFQSVDDSLSPATVLIASESVPTFPLDHDAFFNVIGRFALSKRSETAVVDQTMMVRQDSKIRIPVSPVSQLLVFQNIAPDSQDDKDITEGLYDFSMHLDMTDTLLLGSLTGKVEDMIASSAP